MPSSPAGAGNSSSSSSPHIVAESAASSPASERSAGRGGVSNAVLVIWNKLSASLVEDPASNWNLALSTADELARSVCGQDLEDEFRADLLGNFKLLEQTLSGLKITPSDHCPDPHAHIKNTLSVLKLNIVTDAEDLRKLQSLRTNPSN